MVWLPEVKNRLRGTRPIPHFAPTGPIAPKKFPERGRPLTCARLPTLIRLRFVGVIPERLIFGPLK